MSGNKPLAVIKVTEDREVVILAPAKVNLTLDVLGRRADGYHEVSTVYQAIALSDRLVVRLAPGDRREPFIDVQTDDPTIPGGPANLAHRAVGLLLADLGVTMRVEVLIEKAIPAAAGLGGGSSDAAAALVAVNGLLGGPLGARSLTELAGRLGADVPFFIRGGTALGRGRGERLEPLPDAPPFDVVLAAAGRKPSTGAVYATFDRLAPTLAGVAGPGRSLTAVRAISTGDTRALAAAVGNDLAPAARAVIPELGAVEAGFAGTGAEAVAVSGAGPAVFGLYTDRTRAERALAELRAMCPWTVLTRFGPAEAGEGRASANPSPH
ncbi:MAG TPA: 4-(cytidine 5'-diphospho)-2-C-methyl-D-erythritol kinase [Bacillota bacterium]|jgi:4-diphosphocytidyl-2-C-methyl-D-erythritol kinase